MEKPKFKIHPVMLFALLVNTIVLGAIAFSHFISERMAYGYIFMFFAVVFGTMVFTGIKHNKNFNKKQNK